MYTLENLRVYLDHVSLIENQPKFTGVSAMITLHGTFESETKYRSEKHAVVVGDCGKEAPDLYSSSRKYIAGDCEDFNEPMVFFKPSLGDCQEQTI